MQNLLFTPQIQIAGQQKYVNNIAKKKKENLSIENDTVEYQLDNGLRLILKPNKFVSTITGVIVVKAGAKHDPPEANGIAHLMEHLLFKGGGEIGAIDFKREKRHLDNIGILLKQLRKNIAETQKQAIKQLIKEQGLEAAKYANPNEYNDLLKQIGATEINANTNYDRTIFHSVVPATQLENWLTINSQIFIQPAFRSLMQELEVIKEECRNEEHNVSSEIYTVFLNKCFKTLPYGRNTIRGVLSPDNPPTFEQLIDFYNKHYTPSNMALVLCGNFNTHEALAQVKSTFGTLPPKKDEIEIPGKELAFKGREHIVRKITDKNICLVGFHTPEATHKDNEIIELIELLLTNTHKIGLLDRLESRNKLKNVGILNFTFGEGGSLAVFASPQGRLQSMKCVERNLMKQLEVIKKGRFDDNIFESLKFKLIYNYLSVFEDPTLAAFTLADNIAVGNSASQVSTYVLRIEKISKAEVMAVAQKYFGKNYLSFYAKKGSYTATNDEIETFKPIRNEISKKSNYASKINLSPQKTTKVVTPKIESEAIATGVKLYTSYNPQNDIFRLSFKFEVGESSIKGSGFVASMLETWITEEKNKHILKSHESELTCSVQIYSTATDFCIELSGFEQKLESIIEKMATILKRPEFSLDLKQKQLKLEKEKREQEICNLDIAIEAFNCKITDGNKSKFTDRASLNELKRMKVQDFESIFNKILESNLNIFFSGKTKSEELKKLFSGKTLFKNRPKRAEKTERAPLLLHLNKDKIYFLNNENGLQTHVSFNARINGLNNKQIPTIECFNSYFSGDFSGIILQELREANPLAYSANGIIKLEDNAKNAMFKGYVSTHTDKAINAIETYLNIFRNMPQLPERFKISSEGMINKSIATIPSFREAPYILKQLKDKGLSFNYFFESVEILKKIDFQAMIDFHNTYIKNTNLAICIIGNLQQIGLKNLQKIAPVEVVDIKDLFTL